MALEFTRYLFSSQSSHTETDIPWTVVEDGSGEFRGGSWVVSSLQELEAWAFDASCSCPQYNPSQTTPPLPNTYPILFSSDVVYGREHFSENLKLFRADSYSRKFLVIQDGRYYDLTNTTVRMTFKWALTDPDIDAVITLTSPSNGISFTDPTHGEFQFSLQPSDTVNLPTHRVELFFDAQVTDVNSNVYTVAYGKLIVLPDVSITTP